MRAIDDARSSTIHTLSIPKGNSMEDAVVHDIKRLVMHTGKIPNRKLLVIVRAFGMLMLLGCTVLLVKMAALTIEARFGSIPSAPPAFGWVVVILGILAGIFIEYYTVRIHHKYFLEVTRGFVIDRDTLGGGGFEGKLTWHVELFGYTRANELKTHWVKVSAGACLDAKNNTLVVVDGNRLRLVRN